MNVKQIATNIFAKFKKPAKKVASTAKSLIQDGVKELKEAKYDKITRHTSQNGTTVLLGYKNPGQTRFDVSLAVKPNGEAIAKHYSSSSLMLPIDSNIRRVSTSIYKNDEEIIKKTSQYSYFGTESVESKMPTAVTKTVQGLKSNIKRIFQWSSKNGSTRITEYPSGNTHVLRKDVKGNILERSVTKDKVIKEQAQGSFIDLNTLV